MLEWVQVLKSNLHPIVTNTSTSYSQARAYADIVKGGLIPFIGCLAGV